MKQTKNKKQKQHKMATSHDLVLALPFAPHGPINMKRKRSSSDDEEERPMKRLDVDDMFATLKIKENASQEELEARIMRLLSK